MSVLPVPTGDEQVVESLVPEEAPREEGPGGHRRVQRGVPIRHRLPVVVGLHCKKRKRNSQQSWSERMKTGKNLLRTFFTQYVQLSVQYRI